MFIHHWKKEIFTIPNLLSFFRILLIPVYMTIYLNASGPWDYVLSGSILAVSCITDMIDGQIARKFNMVSTLGKILDPVADKLTQFTLTLCLSVKHPVLRYLLVLFVIKEGFQCIAGLYHLFNHRILSGALPAGKICTTVLFTSLTGLILFPDLSERIVTIIAIIDTVFLFYAFLHYVFAFFGEHAAIERFDD